MGDVLGGVAAMIGLFGTRGRVSGRPILPMLTQRDGMLMDLRTILAPSGMVSTGVPQKIYLDRNRGHMEPSRADERYLGRWTDAELSAWVRTLVTKPWRGNTASSRMPSRERATAPQRKMPHARVPDQRVWSLTARRPLAHWRST